MASNYLQFSIELTVTPGKDGEIRNIIEQIELIDNATEDELNSMGLHPAFQSESGQEFINVLRNECALNFTSVQYSDSPKSLYLFAEDSGSPEQAACFIKMLLDANLIEVEEFTVLEWAETCSKPRPGEFSGGACMISREGITWRECAWAWASDVYRCHD